MKTEKEITGIRVNRERNIVEIPYEQALQIYWLTDLKGNYGDENHLRQGEACRGILRTIAKRLVIPGLPERDVFEVTRELIEQIKR